jgi:hypothetical protein
MKELSNLLAGTAECSEFYFQAWLNAKVANDKGAHHPLGVLVDGYKFYASAYDLLSKGQVQRLLSGDNKADAMKGSKLANDFFSYIRIGTLTDTYQVEKAKCETIATATKAYLKIPIDQPIPLSSTIIDLTVAAPTAPEAQPFALGACHSQCVTGWKQCVQNSGRYADSCKPTLDTCETACSRANECQILRGTNPQYAARKGC